MAKAKKESNLGRVFVTGSGKEYILESVNDTPAGREYVYKWLECPDLKHRFKSNRELDTLDMANEILKYKVEHRIKT